MTHYRVYSLVLISTTVDVESAPAEEFSDAEDAIPSPKAQA
jgi:hypothetical protein